MQKARILGFVSVAAVLVGVVGCGSTSSSGNGTTTGSGSTSTNAAGTSSSTHKFVVGIALSTQTDPFFVSVKQGITDEAKALGLDVVLDDAQNDTATQMSQVEDFISKKVNLIVLNPVVAAPLTPAVLEANHANIPVVTFDRWPTGGQTVTHVGASGVEAGVEEGQALFKYLGGKGKIAVIEQIPGASTTIDRTTGLDQALKQYPGIKVVADQSATSRAQAMTVTENILTAHPDINAVYAYNDDNALGASDAIWAAKKQNSVVVTGVGGTAPAAAAVKQGRILGTIDLQPYLEGQTIVKTALDVLNGKKITEQHQGRTWVLVPGKLVTGPQWAQKINK